MVRKLTGGRLAGYFMAEVMAVHMSHDTPGWMAGPFTTITESLMLSSWGGQFSLTNVINNKFHCQDDGY